MTTGRHLVARGDLRRVRRARWPSKADHLPVGDPATDQVALGPIIDERQRDKVHAPGDRSSVDAGARLAAGGTYEGLFYRPTVLADVTPDMPGVRQGGLRPGRAGHARSTRLDEAAKLAADSEYGLSLGILTRDVMRGLDLARPHPDRHRAHQRPDRRTTRPNTPFGGVGASGTGARFGGAANLDAFTETQWVTMRGDIAPLPVLDARAATTAAASRTQVGIVGAGPAGLLLSHLLRAARHRLGASSRTASRALLRGAAAGRCARARQRPAAARGRPGRAPGSRGPGSRRDLPPVRRRAASHRLPRSDRAARSPCTPRPRW